MTGITFVELPKPTTVSDGRGGNAEEGMQQSVLRRECSSWGGNAAVEEGMQQSVLQKAAETFSRSREPFEALKYQQDIQ